MLSLDMHGWLGRTEKSHVIRRSHSGLPTQQILLIQVTTERLQIGAIPRAHVRKI